MQQAATCFPWPLSLPSCRINDLDLFSLSCQATLSCPLTVLRTACSWQIPLCGGVRNGVLLPRSLGGKSLSALPVQCPKGNAPQVSGRVGIRSGGQRRRCWTECQRGGRSLVPLQAGAGCCAETDPAELGPCQSLRPPGLSECRQKRQTERGPCRASDLLGETSQPGQNLALPFAHSWTELGVLNVSAGQEVAAGFLSPRSSGPYGVGSELSCRTAVTQL